MCIRRKTITGPVGATKPKKPRESGTGGCDRWAHAGAHVPIILSSLAVATVVWLGVACQPGDPETDRISHPPAPDSARPSLVQHDPDFQGIPWTIDPMPLLVLGVTDAAGPQEFHHIVGVHRFSDRRLAVADGGSRQIRFFRENGDFLGAVGGEGGGPGEFRDLTWSKRCGLDSIFAYDFTHRQVSVFDRQGRFHRTFRLEIPGGGALLGEVGCNRIEQFLISGFSRSPPRPGRFHPVAPLALVDVAASTVRTIGEFPTTERHGDVVGGLLRGDFPHPFGRTTVRAVSMRFIYIGTGVASEVQRYTLDGSLDGVIRDVFWTESLTNDHVERALAEAQDRAGSAEYRARLAHRFRTMEMPDSLPPYGQLVLDARGHLWLGPHPASLRQDSPYKVYNPEGGFVAAVAFPGRFRIEEIGEDYVLGVLRDALDVEQVVLYELRRGS